VRGWMTGETTCTRHAKTYMRGPVFSFIHPRFQYQHLFYNGAWDAFPIAYVYSLRSALVWLNLHVQCANRKQKPLSLGRSTRSDACRPRWLRQTVVNGEVDSVDAECTASLGS
jgi:hypothetical protein